MKNADNNMNIHDKTNAMKKILLFIDNLGAGGAQRQICGLAVLLKDTGYDVNVCTYYPHDFYKKYLDENKVRNKIIPGADNTKKRILAVRNFFKKESPDWVIAYQETPSLIACAAKLLGCNYKLIVSERNTTQHVGMNERVRFFLYRWADAIVPNSYSQEKYLAEHHPWLKRKLKTITNFVDLEHFNFVERKKRDVPEIAIAASIWESKNTLGFIDAVADLAKKSFKFHVSWYGKTESNIEYFNKCQRKIEDYGVQEYIELKEKTKQIKTVYQTADFFCLPSFYEGTPNVICEAISTGLPVACSDVCDNSIYVHEGENGFLFNPSDTASITNALTKAFTLNLLDYSKMSVKSRYIAESKLSKSCFLDSYIKILQNGII